MAAKQINFTKSIIEKLPIPKSGLDYYKDSKERGLSLYITSKGVITFFVRKRIGGKDSRVIIGGFPEISVENARKMTLRIKSDVAQGINPNFEKDKLKQEITFDELFYEFMERYSKKQKATWKQDEREINRLCGQWFKRKISTITSQEIRIFHEKLGDQNGIYLANRMLDRIRVIYNKAIEWGYDGENPTNNIKKFKEQSRDRFIQPDELPRFFKALEKEENNIAKDYIYISLYTGARRNNVLSMRWEQINFTTKEWRIPKTKNGDPQTVPLIDDVIKILKARKENNKNLELNDSQSLWVLPSKTSQSGHLEEPKKAWKRILEKAQIEDLRLHDIRRTLGSYQTIAGASDSVVGKTLGHKSKAATAVYARMNLDPVRNSISEAVGLMKNYKVNKKGKK
ncbi:MAG: tyrosine-type recombinase/integrase [Rickettsiales bacterium]|nr:tyrosine-type recombinase/integrase [Rickettsiales bacterium]